MGLFPLVILLGCAMGWIFAGRALTPVLEIARTAQRISGSNLSLRIPSRGAGDELDYLIETFNQMIERIEVNFNQVRQFSTDVSHELRTPITVVRGQLEVALFTRRRRSNTATPSSIRFPISSGFPPSCARCCCSPRPKPAR
jgi:signal transduction histidine kinase